MFREATFRARKMENPALKNFLYFSKWDFSTPSIKNYCFLGEPFRVFHQCFFGCSDFTVDFYYYLLIAFVHSITVSSGVFILPLVLLSFHQLSLPWQGFVWYFVFALLHRECYEFEKAVFILSRFLPYTPSQHWVQLALLSSFPLVWQLHLEDGCRVSHWDPIHLFV